MVNSYPFDLQALSYEYSALSPILGEETQHFHHDKHMSTYVENLNKALEPCEQLHGLSLEELLTKLNQLPESIQTAVRNNGGGVYNHQLYFSTINSANKNTRPSTSLQAALDRDFGGVDAMLEKLKKAAMARFGSGWAYLVSDKEGKLSVCSTPNQDIPDLTQFVPLMTIDVWEHAYYLDYQNRRAEYVDKFIALIDWECVSERYENKV